MRLLCTVIALATFIGVGVWNLQRSSTPSVMSRDELAAVRAGADCWIPFTHDCDVSETDPEVCEAYDRDTDCSDAGQGVFLCISVVQVWAAVDPPPSYTTCSSPGVGTDGDPTFSFEICGGTSTCAPQCQPSPISGNMGCARESFIALDEDTCTPGGGDICELAFSGPLPRAVVLLATLNGFFLVGTFD
jgi:hypothetical protein